MKKMVEVMVVVLNGLKGKLINRVARTKQSFVLTVAMVCLSAVVLSLGMETANTGALVIVSMVAIGLAAWSYVRVSNNMVYLRGFGEVMMVIEDLSAYYALDYEQDHVELVELLSSEFLAGIAQLSKLGVKRVHLTTNPVVARGLRTQTVYQIASEVKKGKRCLQAETMVLNPMTRFLTMRQLNPIFFAKKLTRPVTMRKMVLTLSQA